MDQRIMRYVPKQKRAAVRDCYRDEDGYWICLNAGWVAGPDGCRTIHEDSIRDLREAIKGIVKED